MATSQQNIILAIETSCDDSAVAVCTQQGQVLADVVASQTQQHAPYQGVVPEIASRQHLVQLVQALQQALKQAQLSPSSITHVAVTCAPGLIGSLLVGVQFAKGFAQAHNLPLIAIHHIEGHIAASCTQANYPCPPFIALIASGGHSALYACRQQHQFDMLGCTRDDAAGEAFDKTAKMVGLPYPGGPIIDKHAAQGDPTQFAFPIAMSKSPTLDYSFSGVKTAVRNCIVQLQQQHGKIDGQLLNNLCACVRQAIVQALLDKAFLACQRTGIAALVLGGGVTANPLLRQQAVARGKQQNVSVCLPHIKHCTDNAVMIAHAARLRLQAGYRSSLNITAQATLPLQQADSLYQH
ncbi:MAG: tRNA (adenosine(37)-N6)-threonylcarbamoyltransferase complex transferase subunit TsaD [Myxococcota bacterium]